MPDRLPLQVQLGQVMRSIRTHLGRSQHAIARRMGCTRQHLSAFENGRDLPIPDTWNRWLDAASAASAPVEGGEEWLRELLERAKQLYAQASKGSAGSLEVSATVVDEDPDVRRDTFLKLTAVTVAAATADRPDRVGEQVGDDEITQAVADARKSVAALDHAPAPHSALEELDQAVHALDTAWEHLPLPRVFRRARDLRNQVTAHLGGPVTERSRLRLITLGSIAHAHLADALLDLGYFTAAWTQTSAGLAMAQAANASESQVILHSQRSRIRYWQGSYEVALAEARAGEAAIRPRSVAAVKLYDKLALAAARTGDAAEARRSLHAGQAARDAAGPSTYLAPTGEAFCALSAAETLGVIGELTAARRQAEHAIVTYTRRGSTSVNLTSARFSLAKAQANPAEAAAVGSSAIEAYLAGPRRSQMILVKARLLDAMLPDGVTEVDDFRERLHVLEASTRHAIPGA